MEVGQKVRLRETSIFASLEDRHNPRDKYGYVVEIGNESKDKRRTQELPVVVDWGGFTNSYRYNDLYELH
jgi:hypothetical protein